MQGCKLQVDLPFTDYIYVNNVKMLSIWIYVQKIIPQSDMQTSVVTMETHWTKSEGCWGGSLKTFSHFYRFIPLVWSAKTLICVQFVARITSQPTLDKMS